MPSKAQRNGKHKKLSVPQKGSKSVRIAAQRSPLGSPRAPVLQGALVSQSRTRSTGAPSVSGSPFSADGKCTIRHREFIGDIAGSVGFEVTSLPINPAQSSTFPWLSTVAALYEKYSFRKLRFEYETMKATTAGGTIMMAADFDAVDPLPTAKQAMMAYHNAVRSAPWAECCYTCDKPDLSRNGETRYTRTGTQPAGTDLKTYDAGTIFVATQGCADTTSIGELYVSYEVDLHVPQLNLLPRLAAVSKKIVATGGVSKTEPFGTAQAVTGDLPVTVFDGHTLLFDKVGQYILSTLAIGTGMSSSDAWTVGGTAEAEEQGYCVADTIHGEQLVEFLVNVTEVGQTFTLASPAATVTGFITKISPFLYKLL